MKKSLLFLALSFLMACNADQFNNNNPYLANVNFSKDINTSLPAYNGLQFVSNPVLITDTGVGIQGIIVMKTGSGDSYVAWEASCPNQAPTSCSRLSISSINANCSCDSFSYNLYTGDGGQQYPLKPYRVEVSGTNIRVYN